MKNLAALGLATMLALPTLTTGALAADTYTIDKDHAWVQFALPHAGWSNARGQFRAVSGDISFDKDDVTKSSVSVVIEATSVDTNLQARDDHLRSPDFFNVEEFPTLEFKSTGIEKTGERTAHVTGDLTIAGVTKSVVLDAVWGAEFQLPWDKSTTKTGFSATTSINGLDFGINKMADFGLGPVVQIFIDIEAIKN